MPKKYTETAKKKWLEFYEEGKSETWIANKTKCDPRTVIKALKEERRKKEARTARIEVIKEALTNHHRDLFDELDSIQSSLVLPPEDYAPLSWYHEGNSIFDKHDKGDRGITKTKETKTSDRLKRELLREHLKDEPLFRLLSQIEELYDAEMEQRKTFQRSVALLLQKRTGCILTDKNTAKPFLYSYTAGSLLYQEALGRAFGIGRYPDFEKETVADPSSGTVKFRNILAEIPGKESECKKNILSAFKQIQKAPELMKIVLLRRELREANERAIKAIDRTKLCLILPGECEVCKRLGM